jgi:outer membrane autotransporter protein
MTRSTSARPNWKKTALHSAIAAFCANGLLTTQVHADVICASPISTDQGQCIPESSADIVIQKGVTVSASPRPAVLYLGNLGSYDEGVIIGSLTNNGNILATSSDSEGGEATGVQINEELLGRLTNNGLINGTSEGAFASAYGVREGGGPFMEGSLINSGTISANSTAVPGNGASAIAISIGYGVSGKALIDNLSSGVITATATGSGSLDVIGILTNNSFYGTLNNDGTISATGNGTNETNGDGKRVTGVLAGQLSGTLNNYGTIRATLVDGGEGQAAGVLIGDMSDSTLNNFGTIAGVATDGGEGYSILNYGSEGSSNINNMQAGALRGQLVIYGRDVNVNNSGLVDLPMLQDAGFVGGKFTQTETGTLRIMASGNRSGEYSQLYVNNTANIAGKAFVDVKQINTLVIGQTLNAVVAANLLSGNFTSVQDNSALFNFQSISTLGEDGQIDFKIIKGLTTVDSVNAQNNPSSLGVAGALDKIIDGGTSNPAFQDLIDKLGQLETEEDVANAAEQSAGLLAGNIRIATQAGTDGIRSVIEQRQQMNTGSGAAGGDEFYGDQKVWLMPFGSWTDLDDRNGVSGFDADTAGVVLGADATISDLTRIGVALAYANTDIDSNSNTAPNNADVDMYQVLGYGSHSLDQTTELTFQAGAGQMKTDSERDILFLNETAKGDYNSLFATAGVGLARTLTLDNKTSFTPSVRSDYTWIKDESYTEKGSSANLKVDSQSNDQLVFAIDGELSRELMPGTRIAGNLGLGYDALNSQSTINAAFASQPGIGFTTRGQNPSAWRQSAGLGLTHSTASGMDVSLRYDAEDRQGLTNQTASVKARWNF